MLFIFEILMLSVKYFFIFYFSIFFFICSIFLFFFEKNVFFSLLLGGLTFLIPTLVFFLFISFNFDKNFLKRFYFSEVLKLFVLIIFCLLSIRIGVNILLYFLSFCCIQFTFLVFLFFVKGRMK